MKQMEKRNNEIWELYNNKYTYNEIAEKYTISYGRVYEIVSRRKHRIAFERIFGNDPLFEKVTRRMWYILARSGYNKSFDYNDIIENIDLPLSEFKKKIPLRNFGITSFNELKRAVK